MSSSLLPHALSEDDGSTCIICSSALEDPMLLQCLHNICQACLRDATANVTCTVCHLATDTSRVQSNLLLSSRVHRERVLNNVFTCTRCNDEGNSNATAVAWCYNCQASLCVDCWKYHSKFNSHHKLMPVDERTDLSDLYCQPLRSCTEHGEELKLACFTCQVGRCFKCAHDCYTSSHDIHPLDGSLAAERLKSNVLAAITTLTDLKSTDTVLQTRLSLPGKVADSMKQSMAELKNAKKTAMDSITRAYDRAEESLLECWEILVSKAERVRSSAEFLKKRLDWTIEYSQLALNAEDIVGLLPQLDTLCSCIGSLLDEARQVTPPTDPLKLVSTNMRVPRDVDLIMSDWFGQATLVNDCFDSSLCDFTRETDGDYYERRVATLSELEELFERQKDEQKNLDHERLVVEQLFEHQKEEQANLQHERRSVEKIVEEQMVEREKLERQRHLVEQLLDQQQAEQTNIQRERILLEQRLVQYEEERKHIRNERSMGQLFQMQRDELNNFQRVRQSFEQLLEMQKEEQKSLQRERQSMEQLGIELKLEQQQLAPSRPLRFNDKPRGTFKGPGRCWDVAITPLGRLLVAAMASGLKEYDATSFRETATWIPDDDLLGDGHMASVRTVDALADGRAIVGIKPKLIVLLRRDAASGDGGPEAWQVERRVAELQTPPRRLSVWGFRLLAALEDRWDESTNSWCCGPGLVLLSLSDGQQLHRQKLDYEALSVALTDSTVIVCSENAVKLAESEGGSGCVDKNYVVDCYSHNGVRLWRHVVSSARKVMSLCLDSVGLVLYAAMQGSVVALSAEDGQELCTAVTPNAKEAESSFAMGLDKATRRLLALISFDGLEPNNIAVFSAVKNLSS